MKRPRAGGGTVTRPCNIDIPLGLGVAGTVSIGMLRNDWMDVLDMCLLSFQLKFATSHSLLLLP